MDRAPCALTERFHAQTPPSMGGMMGSWKYWERHSGRSDFRAGSHAGEIATWLVVAVILIIAVPSLASARVHASIVVDAETGRVLEARNPDSLCYPASLAKLMTLYLTFRELSTRKLTLNQELPVSEHAAAQSPTKLYLRPGQTISVRSAILAITTRSANDVAVVLAEAIGGTEWQFADLMNQEARELAMDHTTFRNASGLPNPRQQTTARDMSKLALAILHDYPQYYHFFKARSFDFRGRTIYGHDFLLGRYPGVDGMKTGYTDASGFNIVTSIVRNDHRLVGVVMGGRTARSRDRQMIALLNRSFARIQRGTLASAKYDSDVTAHTTVDDEPAPGNTDEAPAPEAVPVWMVQIGGKFRTPGEARTALRSALHTVPQPLSEAKPLVIKLRFRQYLARFSDMTQSTAVASCRALRHRKFTCKAVENRSSESVLSAERE